VEAELQAHQQVKWNLIGRKNSFIHCILFHAFRCVLKRKIERASRQHFFKEWFSDTGEGLPELHAQHSPFSPARNMRLRQRPLMAWIEIKYKCEITSQHNEKSRTVQ